MKLYTTIALVASCLADTPERDRMVELGKDNIAPVPMFRRLLEGEIQRENAGLPEREEYIKAHADELAPVPELRLLKVNEEQVVEDLGDMPRLRKSRRENKPDQPPPA